MEHLTAFSGVIIQRLIIATVLAIPSWFVVKKYFAESRTSIKFLAFIGSIALFGALFLNPRFYPLVPATLAFGIIAVLDHLNKKD